MGRGVEPPRGTISQDPTADGTDVYAFRTPDDPATARDESTTATLMANFVPFQEPAGGPNFHRFSDQVKYEIKIDNTGDATPDVIYAFRFTTKIANPSSFLYATGPVSYDAARRAYTNLNLSQSYAVTKTTIRGRRTVTRSLGANLLTPPNNVGPKTTPDYASALVPPAIYSRRDGTRIFAGQRDDPFYVDLGGTFDLINFRQAPPAAFSAGGDDGLAGFSVGTIAIQSRSPS